MATYDRRILVPYLQDICSVELVCWQLKKNIEEKTLKIKDYNNYLKGLEYYYKPCKPIQSNYDRDFKVTISSLVVAVLCFFISVSIHLFDYFWDQALGVALFGGVSVAALFSAWLTFPKNRDDEYYAAVQQYKSELEEYEQAAKDREIVKKNLADVKKNVADLQEKLKGVEQLQNELYNVNIIPSRYRNVHAAYYLYDYFSTCMENDLDKIIQTMLLDEIVQQLDSVLDKLDNAIINQRKQIALQEYQNEMIARNHQEEMRALASISKNQYLQTAYLLMIEGNARTSNFFLRYDFLENN